MRRTVGILLLALGMAACSSSGHTATPSPTTAATTTTTPACTVTSQPKLTRIDLKIGGQGRYALVHAPAHWSGKTALPLVLSFHGLGSSATQQRSNDGFVADSDKQNFIVVYPQAGNATGQFGAAWNLKGD